MGEIKLYTINFNPASLVDQTVRVEYRLASSTGAYTLHNNAAPVLANGNFNPEITIPNLTRGEIYTVKVTNLCNGSVKTLNIKVGESCTSFTVSGGLGGATVEWTDCQSGTPLSRYINTNEQFTFCTRTQDGYNVTFGAVNELSNNGACQS